MALRKIFASWSKTNNSATSVSGLANRITLLARSEQGSEAAEHAGGTESNQFAQVFAEYLRRKSSVMKDCAQLLQ